MSWSTLHIFVFRYISFLLFLLLYFGGVCAHQRNKKQKTLQIHIFCGAISCKQCYCLTNWLNVDDDTEKQIQTDFFTIVEKSSAHLFELRRAENAFRRFVKLNNFMYENYIHVFRFAHAIHVRQRYEYQCFGCKIFPAPFSNGNDKRARYKSSLSASLSQYISNFFSNFYWLYRSDFVYRINSNGKCRNRTFSSWLMNFTSNKNQKFT